MIQKLAWQGRIVSVQPRIRLLRSFDERSHSYLGYVLRVDGVIDGEARIFTVGVGEAAQAKHGFRVGDVVCGNLRRRGGPRAGSCRVLQGEPTAAAESGSRVRRAGAALAGQSRRPWRNTVRVAIAGWRRARMTASVLRAYGAVAWRWR